MFEKAKVGEVEEARIDRWARLGTEVSHGPNSDLFSWRCALVGIAFVAVFAVPVAISDGMPVAEELVVTEGIPLFAIAYTLSYYFWDRFKYEGSMVRVVLSPEGLLCRKYSDEHFEKIAYRHVRSVLLSYAGKRNSVLVIRIEYEYPEGLVRTIEFVPARRYKMNEKGEHPLCDEIMRRVKLEKARMRDESAEPASSDSEHVEASA